MRHKIGSKCKLAREMQQTQGAAILSTPLRNLRSHAEKAIWQEMQRMQVVRRDAANS